ncbi:esterase/lipase family protein [Streptomyces sp. NPDC054796]
MEALVLAGHVLLYPTGVRDERPPPLLTALPTSPDEADGTNSADEAGGGASSSPGTGTGTACSLLPTEGRTHPPVLLLHGFVDNRSIFLLLRRALAKHGWCHLYALNHSLLTWDIRVAAERLAEQVEEICARTGHRRIDLIGHSLGGLTARYYVQRLGGDARIRTLITLGTPHSGTRAAPPFSPHPLIRQMRPGSSLLRDLAGPEPDGCRTSFVSFWSDLDELMIPRSTARLDHPDLRVRNVHVRGVGHLSLPVDCAVSARIRAELAGEAHAGALSAASPEAPSASPAGVA